MIGPSRSHDREAALRDARAELAGLEDEHRAVRAELDLVLSSKALRLLSAASHPVWLLGSLWALLIGWSPLRTTSRLWRQLRHHQVWMSRVAPAGTTWMRDLRLGGERHEALAVPVGSCTSFRASVMPAAAVRARCAIMPDGFELCPAPLRFVVRAQRLGDGTATWSAERLLNPAADWRDRRWRPLHLRLPATLDGELVISLAVESTSPGGRGVQALWGDPVVEWPRSAEEQRRLLRGAVDRLRWAGPRGALAYAVGRQRASDEAAAYRQWLGHHRLDASALERLRAETASLAYRPLISIVTPVHDTPPHVLGRAIESVRGQVYDRWELCLADDGSTRRETHEVLERCSGDPRIRIVRLERSSGISGASNAALGLARGEFVALLDHDDELSPDALAHVVRRLNEVPDADVLYSDEDKVDGAGARCEPQFKPDWSPELLLSYNYACHLLVVRRSLIEALGGFRPGFDGAQDYDLLLRLAERTNRIQHIPEVLYHWRKSATSAAAVGTAKPWALLAGRRALEDFAARTGQAADVLDGPFPGTYRFRRRIRGVPLVSIVIPTTGHVRQGREDLLARCLRGLARTAWSRFEIVLAVDGGSISPPARGALSGLCHRVLDYEGGTPFNFSHKVNWAVRRCEGDYVVLLNDDVEPLSVDWLTAMLEWAQEPAVGAVGAKLVYPDGRIQHVGLLIGVGGLASHAFHQLPAGAAGYAGNAVIVRNCSAVTAACLMTRRAVFDEVGGFDEALPVDFNDVDFCLRLRAAGYRTVFTPFARLCHHESASFGRRRQSAREHDRMRRKWGEKLAADPYFNPNLSRGFTDYRLRVS
jgi:GT2 family glycosyltransferase